MTRQYDPNRRVPAPPHPGFDPREVDVDLDVCRWCGAVVPADERQRVKHEEWDRRIVSGFRTLFDHLTSPPVPEQERRPTAFGRSGAEGANHPQPGVDGSLVDASTPPVAVPPAAGGTTRAGGESGGSGKEPSATPAGALWDQGDTP